MASCGVPAPFEILQQSISDADLLPCNAHFPHWKGGSRTSVPFKFQFVPRLVRDCLLATKFLVTMSYGEANIMRALVGCGLTQHLVSIIRLFQSLRKERPGGWLITPAWIEDCIESLLSEILHIAAEMNSGPAVLAVCAAFEVSQITKNKALATSVVSSSPSAMRALFTVGAKLEDEQLLRGTTVAIMRVAEKANIRLSAEQLRILNKPRYVIKTHVSTSDEGEEPSLNPADGALE